MYTCLRSYVCGISVFLQTLIDVVSKVLDISNNQFEGANSNTEESPGTSLLETLDKFALNAFNVSVGSIESNNTSKLVHVHHCCTSVFFWRGRTTNENSRCISISQNKYCHDVRARIYAIFSLASHWLIFPCMMKIP